MLNTLPLPPTRTCPLIEATALEICTPDDDGNDTGIFKTAEEVIQEHVFEEKLENLCVIGGQHLKMVLIDCFVDL